MLSFLTKRENDKSFLDAYVAAIVSNIRIAVLDKRCNIIWVNERFCGLTKYSQHELIGQPINKLNLCLDPLEFKIIFSIISTGEEWSGEVKSQAKDGTFLWIKATILPIKNQHDEIESYLIFNSNITPTKNALEEKDKASEDLRRSEARYRALVENQPDLVSLCKADGTRIYVNSSYCRFVGKDPDALIGTKICKFPITGMPCKFMLKGLALTPQNPETTEIFELENSIGKKFWISICLKGIFDTWGSLYEILTIGRNVTELKNAELRKSDYIEDLERIAFMTSHKVRGPIATTLGLIELLRMNAIHTEQWGSVMDSFKKCIMELDVYTRELSAFIYQRQSSK